MSLARPWVDRCPWVDPWMVPIVMAPIVMAPVSLGLPWIARRWICPLAVVPVMPGLMSGLVRVRPWGVAMVKALVQVAIALWIVPAADPPVQTVR